MTDDTATTLHTLFSQPNSFFCRADTVVRLFEHEQVADVIANLPAEFRQDFIDHAINVYAPTGPRWIIAGLPTPSICLEKFRDWFNKVI